MPGFGSALSATTLPVVETTIGPDYAEEVNAVLQALIDACTPRLVPSQLNVNAALDMNFQRLTNLGLAQFFSATAVDPSVLNSIQFVNGDSYLIDGSGNTIRLSASGTLAASAIGGIVGEYGAGFPNNLVSCVTAGNTYEFVTGTVNRSYLKCKGIKFTDGAGNVATLDPPSAITPHTAKWISGLPASTKLLAISAAGDIAVASSGGVDGYTLNSNQDITFQGTGKTKHGDYEYPQALAWDLIAGGAPAIGLNGLLLSAAGSVKLSGSNGLVVGARIKGFRVSTSRTNAGTMNFDFYRVTSAGTATLVQAFTRVTTGGWAQQLNTLASPLVISANESYFVLCADTAGASIFGGWNAVVDQN